MALRSAHGFTRYGLSCQYHGGSFLGFSYQGKGENCITPTGDLRGVWSVEGRIRSALNGLVGESNFENFQVSSRTDRGVHALKNTFHIDIRPRTWREDVGFDGSNASAITHSSATSVKMWDPSAIHRGLNFHLTRKAHELTSRDNTELEKSHRDGTLPLYRGINGSMHLNSVRILSVANAPLRAYNKFRDTNTDQPEWIDWNARFTATRRKYVYRILNLIQGERDFGIPLEWDRSWRILGALDVDAMNRAADSFIGTHDFSSFRGKLCQRLSPIVTVEDAMVESSPYAIWAGCDTGNAKLVTISVQGEAFLYRQVRNMVGCLVEIGKGKLAPEEVQNIMEKRDRRLAPAMAPAHGLFLVDVEHEGIRL